MTTNGSDMARALQIIDRLCYVAGSTDLVGDLQADCSRIRRILDRRNNRALFDWLVETLSYQGVSDRLAYDYMQRNGRLTWDGVSKGVRKRHACPKLNNYWHFNSCGYSKLTASCSEPGFHANCALPSVNLRNGRLNQLGYSLFLFIRDVADSDLIGWIDSQLRIESARTDNAVDLGRAAIIEPLKNVYGVSDKVLMMTFANVLMGAPAKYRGWFEVGSAMIAIDTLVHAFLARTGILSKLGNDHPYGPACYGEHGCADVILRIAEQIDARKFSASFPAKFPRFVQHAIWQYCALSGLDICNGNQIDDERRCANRRCHVYNLCARKRLKSPKTDEISVL